MGGIKQNEGSLRKRKSTDHGTLEKQEMVEEKKGIHHKLLEVVWGKLSPSEMYQSILLSLVFFMLVAAYWILRIVKDTMFETMIGLENLPTAKMLSVLFNIPLVFGYGHVVGLVPKRHYILYVLFIGYGLLYLLIALSVAFIDVGSVSFEGKCIGWTTFFVVETFGSISIAGFWAYVSDSILPSSAPRLFPLVNTSGQFGSILGPLTAGFCIHEFGLQRGIIFCFAVCGMSLFLCAVAIKFFAKTVLQQPRPRRSASLLSGFLLVTRDSYVRGILGISTLYHTVGTMSDYQLKRMAKIEIPDPVLRTEFMASFGFFTNVTSFIVAILGTSFFLRKLGLTISLLTFPTFVFLSLLWALIQPNLYLLFIALVFHRGLSYALNNPAKEILYTRTTSEVRYQAKTWIDMFGARVAKGLGAFLSQLEVFSDLDSLLFGGTICSLTITSFWLYTAFSTGQAFDNSVDHNRTETVKEEEE